MVEISRRIVARTGEPHGVMSRAGLDGAIFAPINAFNFGSRTDLVFLAVRLLEAIAAIHGFAQGNKRTALHAAIEFLAMNGAVAAFPDTEQVAESIERLVIHELTVEDICGIMAPHIILPG